MNIVYEYVSPFWLHTSIKWYFILWSNKKNWNNAEKARNAISYNIHSIHINTINPTSWSSNHLLLLKNVNLKTSNKESSSIPSCSCKSFLSTEKNEWNIRQQRRHPIQCFENKMEICTHIRWIDSWKHRKKKSFWKRKKVKQQLNVIGFRMCNFFLVCNRIVFNFATIRFYLLAITVNIESKWYFYFIWEFAFWHNLNVLNWDQMLNEISSQISLEDLFEILQ